MSSSSGKGGKGNGSQQQNGGFVFEKAGAGGGGAGGPRKRRGPKQKGAGTIRKSKGEITSGGVTIKEWQRTPKQLIQQYAQSNKRPRVQYRSARSSPGKFKILVVLPDGKNSEKDFRVTSNEEFKSKSEAEQASALLALFKLDGARQYEMKLPEPYRTAWLKLCGRDAGPSAAESTANEFACNFCDKTFKKEHGLTIHRKREHADAIKQAEEEATEAAALLGESGAAASAAGGSGGAKAAAAGPAKASAAAPAPAAFSASWTSSVAKEPKKPKDAPEMVLTSQMHFGSKQEQRLAREEKDRTRRAREARTEARQRSNPLSQVFMSDSCRRRLEECVRRKYDSFPTKKTNTSRDTGGGAATLSSSSATSSSAAVDADTSDADKNAQEYVLAKVVRLGFKQSDAEYALSQTAMPGYSDDALATRVLDWLCVHLPEDSLPKAFDPRGRQFEAVRHGASRNNKTSTTGGGAKASSSGFASSSTRGRTNVKVASGVLLAALGPHHQHGLEDDDESTNDSTTPLDGSGDRVNVVVKAYNRLLEQVGQTAGWPNMPDMLEICGDGVDDDDDDDMFDDEYMALESIFSPSEVTRQTSPSTCIVDGVRMSLLKLTVNTGPLDGVPGVTRVEFWICRKAIRISDDVSLPCCCYPAQVPLVVVVNPALDSDLLAGVSLELFSRAAADMRGSAMLYELWDVSREMLVDSLKDNGSSVKMIGMVRRAALRATHEDATEEEGGEAVATKSNARGGQHGGGRGGRQARGPGRLPSAAETDARSKQLLKQYTDRCQGKGSTGPAFVRMQSARKKLPAGSFREEVLRCVAANQVVLIAGATGCGKTTQIPQFVLEDYIARGQGGKANIVCTQPRRLAAVGVANRVADEQCVPVSGLVGYKIRFENKTSRDTLLCYMTIGVLLRRLQSDPGLRGVTHVVVDEVHERSVESDFLLAILSELLRTRKNLKLILMSATMNEEVFIKYFGRLGSPCPIIRIPGFVHPVEEFYVSDVRNLIAEAGGQDGDYDDDYDGDGYGGGGDYNKSKNKFFRGLPQIDYALIAQLVVYINQSNASDNGSGAILIFLPGTLEIKKCMNEIEATARRSASRDSPRIELVPLHGALSGKDQGRVFSRMPSGTRKVVCCTNVAETSVTVDDCVFVVDTGRMKEMQYDPLNGLAMLVEVWVAKANAKQRRGRAGRVRPGKCFKMFSRSKHQNMAENQMAEIHRTSIEHLVLEVLNLSLGNVYSFLGSLIEPPVRTQINTAVRGLVAIGALGDEDDDDNDNANHKTKAKQQHGGGQAAAGDPKLFLTPLGKHVAILPMEARLGKMLVFGSLLGCAGQMITLSAGLSVRNPFLRPQDKASEADAAKKKFSFGAAQSDHMCLIHAYEQWDACRGERARRSFADEHFLSHTTMNEMAKLRNEFTRALTDLGFTTQDSPETAAAANAPNGSQTRLEMIQLVKAAICAGMYPNVANVWKPPQEYKDTMGGTVAAAPEAKQIRFFAQHTAEDKGNVGIRAGEMWKHLQSLERLYMHPSSVNFDQREFANTLVVFRERVKTSRLFMRDCTVVSPYSVLLFGGKVKVDHAQGTVTVDEWISFKAPARIGVLVQKLRVLLGRLLDAKITDPGMRIELEPEVKVMTLLLMKNGLG